MPLTQGRYAPTVGLSRREAAISRLRWLRGNALSWLLYPPWRRHPADTGNGFALSREWGFWMLRPHRRWHPVRWVTPSMHATRHIPAHDNDAAELWAANILGIPI
jgi:hypothetical protein